MFEIGISTDYKQIFWPRCHDKFELKENEMSSLVAVFEDTVSKCRGNQVLADSIQKSLREQKIILEDDVLDFTSDSVSQGKVRVTKNRTMEAAKGYPNKKVCVLNFASACNPGGGVTKGAHAQEECLCRISTLYPCLNVSKNWDRFYKPHRQLDSLYNSDMIYTPGVTVFKSDTASPVMLDERDWFHVDVVTCAAPNISRCKGRPKGSDVQKIFEKRFERVVLAALGYCCEVLVLGAFGCGAFGNSPSIVAAAAYKVMEKYRYCFETVEFAVYCKPGEENNYRVFRAGLGRML